MIGIVIRRKRSEGQATGLEVAAHFEDRPAPVATPRRGWTNLRGEVLGEMRQLGVDPRDADVDPVRGERRVL